MPNFLNNHYDIYHGRPTLNKLRPEFEYLAKQIFDKGLLRISTVAEYNFCLFPMQNGEKYLSFSKREVYDEKLLKNSKEIIRAHLSPDERKDEQSSIKQKIGLIREEVDKYLPISEEHEMAIARIIVQSSEPVIIQNLINENVYFFISFKHSISDLLSVKNWESARFSQGLQTNSLQEASIFASCGGNPFFDPKESNNEYDGKKAIDRLATILAQEIGHYADIIKDSHGRNIDRFSCELNLLKPKTRTEEARQNDIRNVRKLKEELIELGAAKLFDLERRKAIQGKFRKKTIGYFFLSIRTYLESLSFVNKCRGKKLKFIEDLFNEHKEIGKVSMLLCGDMEFNLNPNSMAYRNTNKQAELAVYCAEALARMPQQKVKWGKEITKTFCPHLYEIYYKDVIKEESRYHKLITGKDFNLKDHKNNKKGFLKKLFS